MTIATMLSLGETALKLGLICSLTVLALFLSYSMLNVCDLSTDGCFAFGAAVGAVVAVSGHPFLSIIAAMAAGIISGFVTAIHIISYFYIQFIVIYFIFFILLND